MNHPSPCSSCCHLFAEVLLPVWVSSLVDENLPQVTFHLTWQTPLYCLGLGGVSLFLDFTTIVGLWRFIKGKRPANSVGALTSYYSHVGPQSVLTLVTLHLNTWTPCTKSWTRCHACLCACMRMLISRRLSPHDVWPVEPVISIVKGCWTWAGPKYTLAMWCEKPCASFPAVSCSGVGSGLLLCLLPTINCDTSGRTFPFFW